MSTILTHPLSSLTPKPQSWTELGIVGCFSWENESQFLADAISIVKPKSILEIGFFAGASSFMWLELSKAKLTSVDPMINLYNANEKHTGSLENVDRLKAYFGPERFRFIQKDSKIVRPDLDASYDLMFIDGDHWDQGIRNDFDIALEKKIPWVLVDDFVTSVEQVYFQSYQQYYDVIRIYPRKDQFMGKPIPIVLLKLKDDKTKAFVSELQQNEKRIIASLNHYSFFGAFAQQNPKAYLSINRLLNARNFDTIIELGTHDGGLSALLALYCFLSKNKSYCENGSEPSLYKNSTHHKSPKKFYTFDIVKRDLSMINLINGLGGNFLQLDTLHNKANIASIGELIKRGGSTLLLCDGGDKKMELNLYGEYLKVGDIVMAHDWAKDEDAHKHNKDTGVWSGWETRWENGVAENEQIGIKDICQKYGIVQIFSEEFDDCAWFCGIKT